MTRASISLQTETAGILRTTAGSYELRSLRTLRSSRRANAKNRYLSDSSCFQNEEKKRSEEEEDWNQGKLVCRTRSRRWKDMKRKRRTKRKKERKKRQGQENKKSNFATKNLPKVSPGLNGRFHWLSLFLSTFAFI